MRLSLYAYDLGPAQNQAIVAECALQKGHRVRSVGNDEFRDAALLTSWPDVVLTGIASVHPEEELDIGSRAAKQNIPWVVLADTHYSCAREAAKGRVSSARLLVAHEREIDEARKFGYRSVDFVGGPPLWQRFAATEPAHLERNVSETLVLLGGSKDCGLTDRMCQDVVSACKAVFGNNWRLVFKPHPNERENVDIERRARVLEGAPLLVSDSPTRNLIPSVDVCVFPPGNTETIAAAHMRRPVISWQDERALDRLERMTGRRTWFPAESGAAIKADSETIRAAIESALKPNDAELVCKIQEEVYPTPSPDAPSVESRILDYLEQLVKAA